MRSPHVRRGIAVLAALVLTLGGIVAVAPPAYAACGDSSAQWSGSTWSGTADDTSGLTAVLAAPVLGVQAAVTVVPGLSGTGVGTWVFDNDTRWTATVAGIWEWHFEVSAQDCSGGQVISAAGAATDQNFVIHYVTLTRTA